MISPYLQKPLRSLTEAEEDKQIKDLRNRHKTIRLANKQAERGQAENVYRFGQRMTTKFGPRST